MAGKRMDIAALYNIRQDAKVIEQLRAELLASNADGGRLLNEIEGLRDLFRKMRKAWFDSYLKRYAHEREWESEEDERIREQHNEAIRNEYDRQTDCILAGEDLPLTPRCWADLRPNK